MKFKLGQSVRKTGQIHEQYIIVAIDVSDKHRPYLIEFVSNEDIKRTDTINDMINQSISKNCEVLKGLNRDAFRDLYWSTSLSLTPSRSENLNLI